MSEWKQGAAARRDERAAKTDKSPRHRAKKDTRHWCKGKVGVEHVTRAVELFPARWGLKAIWRDECINCGRHVCWHNGPTQSGRG